MDGVSVSGVDHEIAAGILHVPGSRDDLVDRHVIPATGIDVPAPKFFTALDLLA